MQTCIMIRSRFEVKSHGNVMSRRDRITGVQLGLHFTFDHPDLM